MTGRLPVGSATQPLPAGLIPPPVIRRASIVDVNAVTGTLAAAFHDGDLAGWLIPDPAIRRIVYPGYFRILAECFLVRGLVEATADLEAVALWWPVVDRLDLDIHRYQERLAAVTGPAVDRFLALDAVMHAHHPTGHPYDYLAFLAVHPDRQSHGLGGALLRHHHIRLDTAGLPAYLEATGQRTRTLYHRHGYRPTRVLNIPHGPSVYAMWRIPQP